MQTSFYASGFLYSIKTEQILLLQSQMSDLTTCYSMLGGKSKKGEDAQVTFQRIIFEALNLNLKLKHIYPVYDYFHETLDKINYVFYAQVKKAHKFDSKKGTSFSWVTFQETPKFLFTARTKQDVVVGERVINLKEREDRAIRDRVAIL